MSLEKYHALAKMEAEVFKKEAEALKKEAEALRLEIQMENKQLEEIAQDATEEQRLEFVDHEWGVWCIGRNPFAGSHLHIADDITTDEDAIKFAKENEYQLINKFKNGKKYYFKCHKNNSRQRTYEMIIEHIKNMPDNQNSSTVVSFVVKLD